MCILVIYFWTPSKLIFAYCQERGAYTELGGGTTKERMARKRGEEEVEAGAEQEGSFAGSQDPFPHSNTAFILTAYKGIP